MHPKTGTFYTNCRWKCFCKLQFLTTRYIRVITFLWQNYRFLWTESIHRHFAFCWLVPLPEVHLQASSEQACAMKCSCARALPHHFLSTLVHCSVWSVEYASLQGCLSACTSRQSDHLLPNSPLTQSPASSNGRSLACIYSHRARGTPKKEVVCILDIYVKVSYEVALSVGMK